MDEGIEKEVIKIAGDLEIRLGKIGVERAAWVGLFLALKDKEDKNEYLSGMTNKKFLKLTKIAKDSLTSGNFPHSDSAVPLLEDKVTHCVSATQQFFSGDSLCYNNAIKKPRKRNSNVLASFGKIQKRTKLN